MPVLHTQDLIMIWQKKGLDLSAYLLRKWYVLLLAAFVTAGMGYFLARSVKPVYTADISFVLSTDQKERNNFAGLANQLGFDGIISSPDNIFAGDNIIELFNSRKLLRAALFSVVDSAKNQNLLNFIAAHQYPELYKKAGILTANTAAYSPAKIKLYRLITREVAQSIKVFKKDKRLVFYLITVSSTDPRIALYLAKFMLYQTSRYFIETKTNVAASSVQLLQHEADSIAHVLRNIYSSTAAMNDRSYNINPSITVQRAASQFNQARVNAFGAAYTEVMRNLEVAKLSLQKETPLYRIIDEPELPLIPVEVSVIKYSLIGAAIGFVLMAMVLAGFRLTKTSKTNP